MVAGVYSRHVNSSLYEAEIIETGIDYSDERYTSPDTNFDVEFQGLPVKCHSKINPNGT